MDQETFETLTLGADTLGDDRLLLVDNVVVQIQRYNGNPIGVEFPPHVELTVTATEPGVRGDTASGGVTKPATLETGLEIRVPLFIKEGEKVKVHTETREGGGGGGGTLRRDRDVPAHQGHADDHVAMMRAMLADPASSWPCTSRRARRCRS